MSAVVLEKIVKNFGKQRVLDNISLKINDGEFCSFLGPSGCGKTTCLRLVAGLDRFDSGAIRIGEKLMAEGGHGSFVPPEKRNLGMVFQSYAVWPHLDVFANVAFPLRVRGEAQESLERRVEEVLQMVELTGLERRKPDQLSGGQQQRVALARALVVKPEVLLLDEPLSNLDAKLRVRMRQDLKRIQKEFGFTAIFVTHDQSEAFYLSDRVVLLDAGKVAQVGSPEELRDQPASDFVRDFLAEDSH